MNPAPGIRPGHDRRGLDQHAEPLLGTEPPGRADDPLGGLGNIALEHAAVRGIDVIEPLGPDRVADDRHPVGPHPGTADLLGLPLRDADHPVHPPQAGPIESLVNPDLPGLGRPAMRHGDHGHARPPCRQQADDVGLVAVAAEDVGIPFPEPARQLAHHGGKMGGVVAKRDRLLARGPGGPGETPGSSLVGEQYEGRPA